ncbi:hypothetical protein GCM10012275_52670 [Longimycelium tulufanense]|uniref:Uncharacterized protein n=1 Tax=Longimycelium tulufanense TaxID=907463 RepID=A0A8J3CCZ4_9PSEU|nr:hypothetical protein [Longimycelium tulufanense]GGM75464.1 hypothetical protein GCM10012275_52670 [Longimycelium tulufanense]
MRPEHAIEQRLTEIRDGLVRVGTVSGTSGTHVIVAVDGANLTLPRLASYTPSTGDVVQILAVRPGAWFVLGKIA